MSLLDLSNTGSGGGPSYFTPFMAWNRLEARPRKVDYQDNLKAKIYDPLWMLGKQWQMGEFQGNDTGSGIAAKTLLNYSKINSLKQSEPTNPPQAFIDTPPEPFVENVNYQFSIKESILLWKKLKQFTDMYSGLTNDFYNHITANALSVIYDTDFDFITNTNSLEDKINLSIIYSDVKVVNFIKANKVKQNNINGAKIFYDLMGLNSNPLISNSINSLFSLSSSAIINITDLTSAFNDFILWVKNTYNINDNFIGGFWKSDSLDYKFEMGDDNNTKLKSKSYSSGNLDWNTFIDDDTSANSNLVNQPMVKELLMTENRFAGMPSSRWWEFENGKVNFCKVDGNTTDLAKIILTQFALVYQDDWFVIPYKIPVGTYSSVDGIVVTDVFGVKTLIKNHNIELELNNNGSPKQFKYKDNYWQDWSWMDIKKETVSSGSSDVSGKMLLPNTLPKIYESKPIEKVTFIRDEMSNMVWAVEEIVPDSMSKGVDGYLKANSLTEYLKNKAMGLSIPSLPTEAKLEYNLMNTVPENWIPFVAKHIPNSNREIHLQRGAMPRILTGLDTTLIRPNTSILLDNSNTTSNAFYINEEEVTKSGTIVETSFQRARWYDGKTYLWVGRQKRNGRGQGNSGLSFDNLTDKE